MSLRHAYRRRLLASLLACVFATAAQAQTPEGHYRFGPNVPAGAVGHERLNRGGPVHGYFQPVEVTAPQGVVVSLAEQGYWTDATDGPVLAGMLIGQVYRVKLSNLEDHPDRDLYPTIEVIDRTYPPPGMERRFPIPIVLNASDLDLALRGLMVTRVVYVEDPALAIPGKQMPGEQLWHDAGPQANALEEADRLGRPVAIVRIGGRVPVEGEGPDWEFLYGSPPWRHLARPTTIAAPPPTILPTEKTARSDRNAARR